MKRTPRRPPAVLVLLVPALMLVVPSVLAQDSEKFQEVLSRAEQGDAPAQAMLGLMYANGEGVPEDDAEAVKWCRKAAEQGNAAAQYNLAFMYANGEGVPENDAEAVKWYRKAAEQGNAAAQYNLAFMYANGEGVPENDAEAVRWYRKAAEQGDADAQSNLGLMYANGEGVPEDDAEAVKWYRKAAEQGDASAQFNLGGMYAIGEGVPADYVLAYAWMNLAAAQGNKNAREGKDLLRPHMTPEQVARAQPRRFPVHPPQEENPSVNSPDFEYGHESELRDVKSVYVYTGRELGVRNNIIKNLKQDKTLAVIDNHADADVVLVFNRDATGYAVIGTRLVWEYKRNWKDVSIKSPSTKFARKFSKLLKRLRRGR